MVLKSGNITHRLLGISSQQNSKILNEYLKLSFCGGDMDSTINILTGQEKGQFFELEDGNTLSIGRDVENAITVIDSFVSRFHLNIRREGERIFVKDLESKNGSFVNGVDIDPGTEVEVDTKCPIVIGTVLFSFGDISATWLNPFLDSINAWFESHIIGKPLTSNKPKILKMILKHIYNFNRSLSELREIKEIVKVTLDTISELMINADRCTIIFFDSKTGSVADVKYRSKSQIDDPESVYNKQLVERALLLKKPVYISNAYAENYGEGDEVVDTLRFMKVKSAICVPMSASSVDGAIYIDSLDESHGFGKSDLALLEDISKHAATVLDGIMRND